MTNNIHFGIQSAQNCYNINLKKGSER